MINANKKHRGLTALHGLFLVGLLFFVAGTAQAQTDDPLGQARAVYNEGEYEQATELFTVLARDESLAMDHRREALRYIGRAYIAQDLMDEARMAVRELLALEPPLAELDPDSEPPTLMDIYYDVRNEVANGPAVAKEDPGMHTLAVMDFRNYAFDDKDRWDAMQWGFSSMMIEQLSGATDLKLVERENIQYLLDELNLQASGHVDQATAVRMGKLLGAHAMVFGSIIVANKKITLSARVVKVETSEILLARSEQGRVKDFYKVIEKLSLEVARSVNSTFEETQIGARTETKDIDAAHAYATGLKLSGQGRYQEGL